MCVVRSGMEPGEAAWKDNLYSDTQHRPLQRRSSSFLAAQSMRGPADPNAAAQPQPPQVQVGGATSRLHRSVSQVVNQSYLLQSPRTNQVSVSDHTRVSNKHRVQGECFGDIH